MVRRVTRVMSTRPFLVHLCPACVLQLSSDLPEWLVLSCNVLSVALNYWSFGWFTTADVVRLV
jgi:hypothetical protein